MRKQHLCILSAMALLSLGSCSNDNTTLDSNEQSNGTTSGMMEFELVDSASSGQTRTVGVYNGHSINFYWSNGDRLWLNTGSGASPLVQSSKDDINSSMPSFDDAKVANARFYFAGLYTADSYPLRYTGNGNTRGDRVTIKSVQNQKYPNRGTHLGADGDCGTATAVRDGGKYKFTLSHKAAYMTFTPYYSHVFAEDVKVTKIKVTADEALTGEYAFDDNGIDLRTRPAANASNRSVTLELNGGHPNGFAIPTRTDHRKNAAIMVFAPGTYHNFTIEYFLYDSKTLVYGSVKQNYGTMTFTPGKNRRVSVDLAVPHYNQNIYYMWDAAANKYAWSGFEKYQPILRGERSYRHYPQTKSDSRWYNEANFPTSASRSAKNNPNANELRWYAEKGDPHWDPSLWCIMTHLYDGSMWLKKRNVIARENGKSLADLKRNAPDGTDYTTNASFKIYSKFVYSNRNIKLGKPVNSNDYILLPTYGYYLSGLFTGPSNRPSEFMHVGQRGYFWSSTPRPDRNLCAYNLYVARGEVHTGYGDRENAHCSWPE